MKREVPMLITFFICLVLILDFVLVWEPLNQMASKINDYTSIVATFAMVLGLGSLANIHLNRIYRKRQNWFYSVVLIAGFLFAVGFALFYGVEKDFSREVSPEQWEGIRTQGDEYESERIHRYFVKLSESNRVEVSEDIYNLPGILESQKEKEVKVKITKKNFWFDSLIFHTIYEPLQATMFSLLAFFMASAAFRAFRAKSTEAVLLLASAFLVMLGRVPIGEEVGKLLSWITAWVPFLHTILGWTAGLFGWEVSGATLFSQISQFIVEVLNAAGQRAIMIGAALGMVAASLRIWFGFEKEHLGRE